MQRSEGGGRLGEINHHHRHIIVFPILVVYSAIFRLLHWNHIRAFVTNIKSLSDNCGIQVSTSADFNMWLFPPARFRFNKADARHGRPFTSFVCTMQMTGFYN